MTVRCIKWIATSYVLVLCMSMLERDAVAAKFNRVLDIGSKAPAWKNLQGTDGKVHSLSDLNRAKAVVVVFTCNHCPVAQAYQKRLIELANDYRKSGVAMVSISVSRYEADNFESMKKRAAEMEYPFHYLQDTTQRIGKVYGALWTPQVFLLDRKRQVVYMGAIDDSLHPEKVQKRYLRDAIDAVVSEKPVEIEETKPVGCPIDYE